jgi:hypothetical protein
MMSRVDARIGASHYTLLATLEVLGKSVAAAQAGWWAANTSFPAVFGVATGLSALFLLVLWPLARTTPPLEVQATLSDP